MSLYNGIKVLMAKNYIDNLSEETRKGMNEKAEPNATGSQHWSWTDLSSPSKDSPPRNGRTPFRTESDNPSAASTIATNTKRTTLGYSKASTVSVAKITGERAR